MARYRFDPSMSRFTVRAFATGLLSFLGHSPTFTVRDFAGSVCFGDTPAADLRLEVTVRAAALELADAVKPADRRDIEETMRRDVLGVAAHPEIAYRAAGAAADAVAAGRYRLRLNGRLSLRGVTREQTVGAELLVFGDGVRVRGESG